MLTALIAKKEHPEWLNKFRTMQAEEEQVVITPEMHPTSEVMTMGEVLDVLNELTKGDAVIVTDVGQHQMVTCRYAKFNKQEAT